MRARMQNERTLGVVTKIDAAGGLEPGALARKLLASTDSDVKLKVRIYARFSGDW